MIHLLMACIFSFIGAINESPCLKIDIIRDYPHLDSYVQIRTDTSRKMTYQEVLNSVHGKYFQSYDAMQKPLTRRYNYWGYLQLYNSLDKPQEFILQLGYPNVNAKVHLVNKQIGHQVIYSGYRFKYQVKDTVKNDNRTFARIVLPPHQLSEVLFEVSRNRLTPDIFLTPGLYTSESWELQVHGKIIFQGMIQGFLIMFITLVFVLFLVNRDKAFLYYSLYFLTLFLNFSISENFMIGSLIIQKLQGNVILIISCPYIGIGYFYPRFIRNLLNLDSIDKASDRSLKGFSWIALLTYPFILWIIYAQWLYAYEIWMSFMFLSFIYASVVSIKIVLKNKHSLAKYIIVGLAFTHIGSILHFLTFKFNIIETDMFLFLELGVFFEAILFLIALGYKLRRSEIEILNSKKDTLEKEKELAVRDELDKVKTKAIASLSHEFKTPLTVIKGCVELLHAKEFTDTKGAYEAMAQSSKKLLNMINQLLDVVKLDQKPEKVLQKLKEASSEVDFQNDEEEINTSTVLVDEEVGSLPIILVVDDNKNLIEYVAKVLQNKYRVIGALNGKKGYSMACDKIPDLIISDIIMPAMNGYELAKKIKNEEKTSHIPIILLSARSDVDSKIKGLMTGVDDYLQKPFEQRELKARIDNLIRQRKKMRQKYYQAILPEVKPTSLSALDDNFLKKITSLIKANMSNEAFNVDMLGREVGYSRAHLHRKIKALTNHSPSYLIRHMRLNKAAEILRESSSNISEIALEVGFSNPSHFAQCFYRQFSVNPKQYAKKTDVKALRKPDKDL